MPIRKDLLPLYRTPEYKAARARVVLRAGDCCEQCKKPNGEKVETVTGWLWNMDSTLGGCRQVPVMAWRSVGSGWRHWNGWVAREFQQCGLKSRFIRVVLTLAHLDHNPANNADGNLKLLCQWCHLNWDKVHHHETRGARKDQARPLLNTGQSVASNLLSDDLAQGR